MHLFKTTVVAALLTTLFGHVPASGAQNTQGTVRVEVTDESGAVLPGVTVIVSSPDGQVIATDVTNETGTFVFAALPVGPVTIRFQLDGFAPVVRDVTVQPGESLVAEHLALASLAETIVVSGRAPREPRPQIVLKPVPTHDRDSICGPSKPDAASEPLGTIRSIQRVGQRALYAKADEITIDGGTLDGLETGLNVVARRHYFVDPTRGAGARGEHTAGVLQIVAADERSSKAVVVYACDEMMSGDFLAPFEPEPLQLPESIGVANYDEAARILFGDAGQLLGAPRRMMVIDQGLQHGIRAGQRLTLFRKRRSDTNRSVVGDAIVVAVRTDSATIKIQDATDAIEPGDWAAPQRRVPQRSER